MPAYFVDSSALVKRYVLETGTAWVRRLTRQSSINHIYIARLTTVEVTAALARRRKGGTIAPPGVSTLLWRFRPHLAARDTVVEITPGLLSDAVSLANKHSLRAYDAVQLAAALTLLTQGAAVGLGAITLVSAGQEMNAAATAEGLTVDDPNNYP